MTEKFTPVFGSYHLFFKYKMFRRLFSVIIMINLVFSNTNDNVSTLKLVYILGVLKSDG